MRNQSVSLIVWPKQGTRRATAAKPAEEDDDDDDGEEMSAGV